MDYTTAEQYEREHVKKKLNENEFNLYSITKTIKKIISFLYIGTL